MPLNTNALKGMFEPRFFAGTTRKNKAAGIAIAKGDICNIDAGTAPDSYQTAPNAGIGPFVWAEETVAAAAGKTSFSAIDYECEVYVVANGAIEVGAYVMTSGATPGQVIAFAGNTATNRVCGIYLRKPGTGDSSAALTAAADTDVIIIRFLPNAGPAIGA